MKSGSRLLFGTANGVQGLIQASRCGATRIYRRGGGSELVFGVSREVGSFDFATFAA